jgi:murein DD-endopeptidase MepM/ murein hydrolase activator NlpD
MHDTINLEPITKNTRFVLREDARAKPQPWHWPLGRLGNRDPIVLTGHEENGVRSVDLGYVAAAFDSELFVPIYAAQSGEVSHAIETEHGFEVALDHGGRTWGTLYAHLSKMFVTRCLPRLRRRQSVRAGDVIGYAAKAPLHVRFGLWQWTEEKGFVSVDPREQLKQWTVYSPINDRRTPGKDAA